MLLRTPWLAGLFAATLLFNQGFRVLHAADSPATPKVDRQPLKVLLIAGGCCHDYTEQVKILSEGIAARANVQVTVHLDPSTGTDARFKVYDSENWADDYDVVIHNECNADVKDPQFTQRILKPHHAGKPAVVIHCAMHCYRDGTDEWFKFLGVTSRGHGAHYPFTVVNLARDNPIMAKFGKEWKTPKGELYHIEKVWDTATVLAHAEREGDGPNKTLDATIWTNQYGQGRVFGTTVGHYNEEMSDPVFLDYVTRGLLWSCDKLNDDYLKTAAAAGPEQDQIGVKSPGSAADAPQPTPAPEGASGENVAVATPLDLTPHEATITPKEELLKGIKIPAGFSARLFAAPPRVGYPVGLCVAPNGDVYVAVDENSSIDREPNRGRILRCRDTNKDNVADDITTFATLDSPRGLFHDGARLYVMHPPTLSVLTDENGDGVSDKQQALVEGLGFDLKFRGADHTTNQLQMGSDGRLYIAVGDYGFTAAKDRSGRKLALRGGGIVRVGTDGTGLEIVSRGQRNIYDVAVSPMLELFTRDNTNDGGGWDVRLTHVLPGAQCGYPSLFTNFSAEIWQPLAVYGGGSPCGSYFIDEPLLPGEVGRTLLTCDWGRNFVYRHPLTPAGGSYVAQQAELFELPRPVDIDYDGAGRFFVASWKDGGFTFSNENVGYVVCIQHDATAKNSLPHDPAQQDIETLIADLQSESHRRRLFAQCELQRRLFPLSPRERDPVADITNTKNPAMMLANTERAKILTTLREYFFDKNIPAPGRLAIWPLLARDLRDAGEPEQRDFINRLTHQLLANHDPLSPFIAQILIQHPFAEHELAPQALRQMLADADPRVRLNAVSYAAGLPISRLLLTMLVKRLADEDPAVAHLAERTLLQLGGNLSSIRGFEHPFNTSTQNPEFLTGLIATLGTGLTDDQPRIVAATARILGQIPLAAAVRELTTVAKSSRATDTQRAAALAGLCRAYFTDKQAGEWWGTRPDTSGPMYDPAKWSESDAIGKTLTELLAAAEGDARGAILRELMRHKIDLPEFLPAARRFARQNAIFRAELVRYFQRREPAEEDRLMLKVVAIDPQTPPELRALALSILWQPDPGKESFSDGLSALAAIHQGGVAVEQITHFENEQYNDNRWRRHVGELTKLLAESQVPEERAILVQLLTAAARGKEEQGAERERWMAAQGEVRAALRSETLATMALAAIARQEAREFAEDVRACCKSPDQAIRAAAEKAALALRLDLAAESSDQPRIGPLKVEDVLAAALKLPGDPARGETHFTRQQCVNCHTVKKADSPKGPYLGDIAKRYKRAELLESILKPSAKIAQGFETQYFELADGLTHEGFVVRESATEVEIRNSKGEQFILPKEEIASRVKREQSVMPQGVVDQLTVEELASLVAYLEGLMGE